MIQLNCTRAGHRIKTLLRRLIWSSVCSPSLLFYSNASSSSSYSSSPSLPPSLCWDRVYCLLSLLLWRNRQHASQECKHTQIPTHIDTHTRTHTHTHAHSQPPDALPALRVIVFGTWPLSLLHYTHTHTHTHTHTYHTQNTHSPLAWLLPWQTAPAE